MFNLEEMLEKYGADLVSRELEVEAKFKFMGQEATRKEYMATIAFFKTARSE